MLRKASRLFLKRFGGLNSYVHLENVAPEWWAAALNVAVNANGSAEALRSPKAFNDIVGSGNPVISMADYLTPITHKLLFDIEIDESDESSSGDDAGLGQLATYTINDDYTNKLIRQGQYHRPFISGVVNDKLFRVNEAEFIQCQTNAEIFFRVGIDPPESAPEIAYAADSDSVSDSSDDQIKDGIQFSYAYHNPATGHVSNASPVSNRLSEGGEAITVPVVASTQYGVDYICFFATEDGGAIPYLLIDENADMFVVPNVTGTITFDTSNLRRDTQTPETIFNNIPPLGAKFMFTWKDRVFLLDFLATYQAAGEIIPPSVLAYSGFESTYAGNPGESWPPLNRIGIPSRGEVLRGGIGTQVGALILSDLDAYLISGYPTDKTSGPEASTAVTEHLEPLHWNIGTQSPRTMRNTPYGTVWLDHAKRLRLWKGDSFPTEVGIPLRTELAKLDSARLEECEGQWFQMGEAGGFYLLTGPLKDNGGQRLFIITLYQDAETQDQQYGYAISDIEAYSIQPVRVFSDIRLFIGGIDRTFTILSPTQEGDGWPEDTKIFFELMLGNDGNFGYWHSISFDGDIQGLTVTIRNFKESVEEAKVIEIEQDLDTGAAWYGLLDTEGRRKVLRFEFNPLDIPDSADSSEESSTEGDDFRQIKNLQIFYQNKRRVI